MIILVGMGNELKSQSPTLIGANLRQVYNGVVISANSFSWLWIGDSPIIREI